MMCTVYVYCVCTSDWNNYMYSFYKQLKDLLNMVAQKTLSTTCTLIPVYTHPCDLVYTTVPILVTWCIQQYIHPYDLVYTTVPILVTWYIQQYPSL